MKTRSSKSFWQAIGLGILAGMRTTAAPIIANQMLIAQPNHRLFKSPFSFMQSRKTGVVLKFLGGGELIGDKLPNTPNRTGPLGIAARCLSGALAASCIYKANEKNAVAGAMLGVTTALASTFGCYFLRKAIVKQTAINDPWIGGMEDLLVVATGLALIKTDV